MSTAYYDTHAEAFVAGSIDADMGALHARFLRHVPAGGEVLDAGCGSGRDSLAFLKAGYRVTALDGSVEMVRRATALTGLAVEHKRFADFVDPDRFDGIWACASLLHVPMRELVATVAQMARALKLGGVFFLSFKTGDTERLVVGDILPTLPSHV